MVVVELDARDEWYGVGPVFGTSSIDALIRGEGNFGLGSALTISFWLDQLVIVYWVTPRRPHRFITVGPSGYPGGVLTAGFDRNVRGRRGPVVVATPSSAWLPVVGGSGVSLVSPSRVVERFDSVVLVAAADVGVGAGDVGWPRIRRRQARGVKGKTIRHKSSQVAGSDR